MLERWGAFERAFAYLACNRIRGAVVEFGVHRGESLAVLARLAVGRGVAGYDSFQGLPAPSEHDTDQFAEGALRATPQEVRAALHVAGIRPDRVVLHEGWFRDQESPEGPVALVHLDCDLYESARDALALLGPKNLADGAVLLVDDYYCHRAHPQRGVRRALTEWLEARGLTSTWFSRYGWHAAGFVVHGGER